MVEPDPARRAEFQRRYRIPPQRAFADVDELLAVPRFADIVFICTPDPTHFDVCRAASAYGYDVLLEKPIATNLADCLQLLDLQHTHGNRIFVAHVLRYAPFFRRIKEIIDEGRFGAVRHVQLAENVGHWHFAHSYVRGNWRRAADSAPIILTKSSHDLESRLADGRRVPRSPLWRALLLHGGERAAGRRRALRGVPAPETCSTARPVLPERSMSGRSTSSRRVRRPSARRRALEAGPTAAASGAATTTPATSDRDARFDGGPIATSDCSPTPRTTPKITIRFDGPALRRSNRLEVSHFTGRKDELVVEEIPLPAYADAHGGGDLALLQALHAHLTTGEHEDVMTSLETSLPSHVLAFLAEESRRAGGERVTVPDIFGSRTVAVGK